MTYQTPLLTSTSAVRIETPLPMMWDKQWVGLQSFRSLMHCLTPITQWLHGDQCMPEVWDFLFFLFWPRHMFLSFLQSPEMPWGFQKCLATKSWGCIASVLQVSSHKTEANRYCIEVQVSGEQEEFIRSLIVLQFVLRRRYTTVVMLKTNRAAISEYKYIYIYIYVYIHTFIHLHGYV